MKIRTHGLARRSRPTLSGRPVQENKELDVLPGKRPVPESWQCSRMVRVYVEAQSTPDSGTVR